jgi:hypothetical protein
MNARIDQIAALTDAAIYDAHTLAARAAAVYEAVEPPTGSRFEVCYSCGEEFVTRERATGFAELCGACFTEGL